MPLSKAPTAYAILKNFNLVTTDSSPLQSCQFDGQLTWRQHLGTSLPSRSAGTGRPWTSARTRRRWIPAGSARSYSGPPPGSASSDRASCSRTTRCRNSARRRRPSGWRYRPSPRRTSSAADGRPATSSRACSECSSAPPVTQICFILLFTILYLRGSRVDNIAQY